MSAGDVNRTADASLKSDLSVLEQYADNGVSYVSAGNAVSALGENNGEEFRVKVEHGPMWNVEFYVDSSLEDCVATGAATRGQTVRQLANRYLDG